MTMFPFEFFTKTSLANILSFAVVAHIFWITVGTDIKSAINVSFEDGTIINFKQCSGGLYYYYTTNM